VFLLLLLDIKIKGFKMKEIISKELLSEVLGVDIENIQSNLILNNKLIEYSIRRGQEVNFINIYELANYHCKEWAFSKGFILASGLNQKQQGWCDTIKKDLFMEEIEGTFVEHTEHEAIIEACQWIKDKK
jgi:hypothetical protein